jgi:poly-gamma-glutamate synthesis protein (capsule biosynthesis protein)
MSVAHAAAILLRIASTLLAAAPNASSSPGHGATATSETSATVVFGGDIVPHRDLLSAFAENGGDDLFGAVSPVLQAADLALANFETPAAPSRPLTQTTVRFNVHADFVQALAHSGFDAVAMANNHSFDTGVAGVGETVSTLRSAGIRVIGGALAGEDPMTAQTFPLAGGTLCIFAATRILNFDMTMPGPGQPRIALARSQPPEEQNALLAAVRASRARCGAVIVSLHSGVEYQERPEPIDRIYFRRLADAGADVVIAHHSHVVQPIELYRAGARSVPIFYSLGNFVSNQGNTADSGVNPAPGATPSIALDARLREGILAVLRFENAGGHMLRLAEFGYVPMWTVNTRIVASRTGEPLHIRAALMPRDGGGDRLLHERWERLVRRIGADHLLPATSLPGSVEAYSRSDEAVLASRRALTNPAR